MSFSTFVSPEKEKAFTLVGKAGQLFNIRPVAEGAKIFGDGAGVITVGGINVNANVMTWRAEVIKGELPVGLKTGEIVIVRKDGVELRGRFDG
jgi:hypothetical protein